MSQGSPRTGTAELNIGFVSLITVRSMDRGNSEHTEHSVRVEVRTCLSVPVDAAEALRLPPFCQLQLTLATPTYSFKVRVHSFLAVFLFSSSATMAWSLRPLSRDWRGFPSLSRLASQSKVRYIQ